MRKEPVEYPRYERSVRKEFGSSTRSIILVSQWSIPRLERVYQIYFINDPPRALREPTCQTNRRPSCSPDPAAQRAEITMYEVAAGVHSDAAIDEGLDVAGDRVVIDIRNMDVERHCTHVL